MHRILPPGTGKPGNRSKANNLFATNRLERGIYVPISMITFTSTGEALAQKIKERQPKENISITNRHRDKQFSLTEWTKACFARKDAIVVIGAAGIAIRMIAPFVNDKLQDSPVVVVDEGGQFVIPLLSGHVGGANGLAEQLAEAIGAIPVLTTATDVQQTFAVDMFAKRNHLTIQNRAGIARITSKVLDKEMVDIVISRDLTELSHGILRLKPKEYILGIGCRKGKSYEELDAFIQKRLTGQQLEKDDILAVASIDLKEKEECLVRWCNSHRIPFVTYSAEILQQVAGNYTASAFVEARTGVDNVCERAAMAAAGEKGELIVSKQAESGMTLAIARKPWKWKPERQKGLVVEDA